MYVPSSRRLSCTSSAAHEGTTEVRVSGDIRPPNPAATATTADLFSSNG
ncbi:hypothetical protein OHU34_11900 [Streptomyces sp. NBC_00080]|nr:hypothetical protein [Streptomyces coriariae]